MPINSGSLSLRQLGHNQQFDALDASPQTFGPSFAKGAVTRGQLGELATQGDEFKSLRQGVNAAIGNAPERDATRTFNAANSASQQQLGDQQTGAVTHRDVLSNALRRAKARVGVAQRGDAASRNQQLKDRLAQVRSGIARQGRAIQTQIEGANIRAGVNVGVDAARQRSGNARAGAIGAVAGGLAATAKDYFTRPQPVFTEQPLGGTQP